MEVFLDTAAVAARYGLSIRTIRRMVDRGEFVRPRRMGRLLRWKLDELVAWESFSKGLK